MSIGIAHMGPIVFRDECLNERWFLSIWHACEVIAAWREKYNTVRSHSSLGYISPTEFAAAQDSRTMHTASTEARPQEFDAR